MCQACVDATRELFPEADDEEVGVILMEHTAFPMASAETVRAQLVKLKEARDRKEAICYMCGAAFRHPEGWTGVVHDHEECLPGPGRR